MAISGKGRAGSEWPKGVQTEPKCWIKNISTMTQSKKLVETFEWTSTKYAVEYLNESVSSFGYSSLLFDLMYNRTSSVIVIFLGEKIPDFELIDFLDNVKYFCEGSNLLSEGEWEIVKGDSDLNNAPLIFINQLNSSDLSI